MTATPWADCTQRLALRPGVVLGTNDDELRLLRRQIWRPEESFGAPNPVKRALLARLARGASTSAELLAVGGADDEAASFIDALEAGGWLERTVSFAGRELYTMQPLCPATSYGARR
jgi:hypothetical protein